VDVEVFYVRGVIVDPIVSVFHGFVVDSFPPSWGHISEPGFYVSMVRGSGVLVVLAEEG